MIDLFRELTEVVSALDQAGISYALVGGLAYSIWVESRNTEDIDLLVLPEDWPRIPSLLAPLGYHDLSGPLDLKDIRIRRLTKLPEDDVLVLDFLLADGDLADGLARRVIVEYRGHCYAVAPPDIIIRLKRGRMSAKDRSDIEGLERILDQERNE